MASSTNIQEENQLLQQELNKVEDLLSQARAERDEILIKYNALSDRVSCLFLDCLFVFVCGGYF
jgi:rootletin